MGAGLERDVAGSGCIEPAQRSAIEIV